MSVDTLFDNLFRGQSRLTVDGIAERTPNVHTRRTWPATVERSEDDLKNRRGGRCEREALGAQYGDDLELGPEGARALGCAKRAVGNRGSYSCDRRISRCCPDYPAASRIG